MKRILLGSAAMMTTMAFAYPALAQVELSISGSTDFQGGWVDEDGADADRDYDFRQEGVIQFNADGVADNGLEYGAEIELDDIASDEGVEVDEQWIYIGGGFGEVRLGDKEGADANFAVTAPLAGSGGFDGDYGEFMLGNAGSYLLDTSDALDDADATRVQYYTPKLGGFQGGISYAAADASGKDGADDRTATGTDIENLIELGGNYGVTVGGFDIVAGAGYVFGEGTNSLDGEGDHNGYQAGLNVGFGGFTVGAAYVLMDDLATDLDEEQTIQVGATYELAAWTVGASAAFDTREWDAGGEADTDIYTLNADYKLAPGLTLYSDLSFVDAEATPTEAANEATVFLVGTSVAF